MTTTTTELTGRTALVTGASHGIGRSVALHLADRGAAVVAHGRDAESGAALLDEIGRRGGTARFVVADLADVAQVARLAEDAGDVDVLVNNAGIYSFTDTPGTSAAEFDRLLARSTPGRRSCW